MSPVRVSAVTYLNSRPLVHGLDRQPGRFSLRYDVPSLCAALLHEGQVDLGLIPSIEYLTREEYRIVPGVAVASRGPVASVCVFTRRPMGDVRSIALDTSSRASAALLRVLSARYFRITPEFVPLPPDLEVMLERCDAALLIGDLALQHAAAPGDLETIDLGQAWTACTGLPFVWAAWVGRAGVLAPGDVELLQVARDVGVASVDDIAAAVAPDEPGRRLAARYLRHNIRFWLGEPEREGLERYYAYAAEEGIVARARPPQFY